MCEKAAICMTSNMSKTLSDGTGFKEFIIRKILTFSLLRCFQQTVYLILFPMSSFSLFFATNSTSKKIQYAKMIHCIVCFIFMKLFNLQKWLIQIKKLHICPILCWFCDTYEKKPDKQYCIKSYFCPSSPSFVKR